MRAFKALRCDPDPAYNAVVIGAGIGGLICANLLARSQLRVLLVEQHYMAGGYCSTFRRKGFTFDAATHFYPLLGNPRTITGALLERLGSRTRWVKMDPVDHFHFPDGSSFSVSADFNTYLSTLKALFPHDQSALDTFFELARDAYLYGLLYYFRGRAHERLEPLRTLSLRETLDRHIRDPKLKLLLAADCAHWGSPPSRTSFVFDAMLRLSYFLGNYYPEGGSQAFADDLAARFEEQGGHILMSTTAERILVDRNTATGVELLTGIGLRRHRVRVRAEHIVSNADLLLTLEQMLAVPAAAPPAVALSATPSVAAPSAATTRAVATPTTAALATDHLQRAQQLRPTSPCFLVHIGLRDIALDDLRQASGYHWRSWDPDRVTHDAFKIFIPTMYEPKMAPPGGQIIILQRIMELDYDGVTDWEAHKRTVEADLLERLEAALPGIAAHIVTVQSASALTSWRYTRNYRGAMLGWEMSPEQLGDGRPSIEGPAKNLYFTGHWTRPGGGITPVIVSAMEVARAITGSTP